MTTYLVVFGLLTLWLIYDGLKRSMGGKIALWAIGGLLLGPIILPVYFAKRPLRANEVREGGFAWNVLKNFALFWTIFMVAMAITGLAGAAGGPAPASDAEAAGAAIGSILVVFILAVVWFFPMVGAIVLGFFLKKSAVVERGPTGPLSGTERVA